MKSLLSYVLFRKRLRKNMIRAIYAADAPKLKQELASAPSGDQKLVGQMWANYLPIEMAFRAGFAQGVSLLLKAGAALTPACTQILAENLQSKEPEVRAGAEDILRTMARDGLTMEEWDRPIMLEGKMTSLREVLADRFLEAAPGDPYYTPAPEVGTADDIENPATVQDRPAAGQERQMWQRPTPWSAPRPPGL